MIEGQEGVTWPQWQAIADACEQHGIPALYRSDHYLPLGGRLEREVHDAWATIIALAATTRRLRLGALVSPATFRHPSVLAKMAVTADHVSGGRVDIGLGAGWKREEWEAYGYRFPPARERLAALKDALEVITRMVAPGRASYAGPHAVVIEAINEPRGIQQPTIPIMVGGNGREVTWRLAARFADELNLDAMPPEDVAAAMPVLADRCREVGRDPDSLRVSVHIWWEHMPQAPAAIAELLERYATLGVARVQTLPRDAVIDRDALYRLAEASHLAGARMSAA